MEGAIRARAEQVGRLGEWLGVFDLLVYAVMERTVVKVWFGGELVNLLEMFLPIEYSLLPEDAPVVHLVATQVAAGDTLPVEDVRSMNHWIAASKLLEVQVVREEGRQRDLLSRGNVLHQAHEQKLLLSQQEGFGRIVAFYREKGFMVHKTVAQGDCAVDALLLCEGRERGPRQWQLVRSDLMEAMWNFSCEKTWQDAYAMCGEDAAPAVLDQGDQENGGVEADLDLEEKDEASLGDSGAWLVPEALSAMSQELCDAFAASVGTPKTSKNMLVASMQLSGMRTDLDVARGRAKMMTRNTERSLQFGQQVRATVQNRLALGLSFNAFKKRHVADVRQRKRYFVKQFCKQHLRGQWSKGVAKRLYDAGKLAEKYEEIDLGLAAGTRQHPMMKGVDAKWRKNIRSLQGRPEKGLAVSQALFAWFVDIRGSIAGRMPIKVMLAKARMLLVDYVARMLSIGSVPVIPSLTHCWLYRWKKRYGVSFRKPNRRYKLSRRGLLLRLKIFWTNNIRVRYFALKMLKIDPGQHSDNVDEKGWHMNQAGSKDVGTLELAGAPKVVLKENHAATRERLSFMTYTSNNREHIRRGLPLETCFKVQSSGERILAGLRLASDKFSARVSDSGSYREEHVFLYLQMHLEQATQDRVKEKDWRLFYVDIYSGHLSYRIWKLCWDRMYVLLYHGGGTTGLTQPNDLWLHRMMEIEIGHLESVAFLQKGLLRPSKVPSMTRQEVLDQASTVWLHSLPHERSIAVTKGAGISLALDGTEDAVESVRQW